MYAQKLIDEAQGDENKLYDLFIQKTCRTSHTPRCRRILRSVKKCRKKKYYLYREDGTEDIKVIKYKENENEVYSLTGAHFSDEKKIMTDSDLKTI